MTISGTQSAVKNQQMISLKQGCVPEIVCECLEVCELDKVIHVMFDVIIAFFVKFIGIVMILSVLLQIASRYLPFSLMWTDELGRLSFMWFCLLSTGIAFEKGNHLCIDYFYIKFGKKVRNVLDYLVLLIVLVFSVIISVNGYLLLEIVSVQKSPVMHLPMSYFYAAIPVGFTLIIIFCILKLIQRIFDKTPEDQDNDYACFVD